MAAVPLPKATVPTTPGAASEPQVTRRPDGTPSAVFFALGCRCELLFDSDHVDAAREVATAAAREAQRVESKFTLLGADSVVANANRNPGKPIDVDEETARLVDVAVRAYVRSGGRFDVTTGLLRRAWAFDGSDNLPKQDRIDALLEHVGLDRLGWDPPRLVVPLGIELDFGGLCKRYAVDRIIDVIRPATRASVLVDVGGDLAVSCAPRGSPWRVRVHRATKGATAPIVDLAEGALATSGDSRRFMLKNGVRYGDLLDPRTGWPVLEAPRMVTVAAANCIEAGMVATIARLHARDAGIYLDELGARHWIVPH
ncbi:MAG TPA: FAD:protein FMN transferase [Burkholderiaceae bacterium]|nr:FAD:protein FMN transferase [Burkholderiaceae bacterium]